MNNSNTVLGVLAGTAVGAIIGMLYAPDKGINTRRKISEKAMETRDHLMESAAHLKDNVVDTLASKKMSLDSKLDEIASDASYKAEDVITKLEAKLKALKEQNKKMQKPA